ncbi:MAG: hypothetical protein AB7P16_24995 [Bradyrhizobium sp.]|uniref:hypothetical protein n=1 Tax=Bradyrhizobium sp. TaxID=376 RepID=UPI003D146E59
MDMKTYWQSLSAKQKDDLALTLECNRTYLAQIACGARRASPILARKIDEYSRGTCPKEQLRPDVFGSVTEQPAA